MSLRVTIILSVESFGDGPTVLSTRLKCFKFLLVFRSRGKIIDKIEMELRVYMRSTPTDSKAIEQQL